MFGRRKRNIHREADQLRHQFEHLEGEAEKLHAELESLESRKNDPYARLISMPLNGPDVRPPRAGMRAAQQPTRRQFRRKRNVAVAMIVAAVLALVWIAAKIWRYLG
jgi:hypothetical protein